jgi:hypothetical protein
MCEITELERVAFSIGLLERRDGVVWNCGGHGFGCNLVNIYWEDADQENLEAIYIADKDDKSGTYYLESEANKLIEKLIELDVTFIE